MGSLFNYGYRAIQEESELQHFSHVHTLQPFDVRHHGEAVCNACNRPCLVGPAYRCAPCNYFLDRTCAHTPRAIRHPGHPGHTLNLQAYIGGSFSCGACGGRGTSFYFHCTACEFDLHISCANAPLQLHHHSHPHPLALTFSPPYGGISFACDVCRQMGGGNNWLYRCASCCFDVHIGCATSPTRPQDYYQYQQPQQQQPQEEPPSCVPHSTPQSFQNPPSPQPPEKGPVPESQLGAVDDALAIQLLAFSMQQAQLQNQMVNDMVQSHNQRMARPFSTWQVEETFMSAPKVPRPDVGGHMNMLMQNLTNSSLNAGSLLAAATALPVVGTSTPLSGMLGQVAQGEGGLSGQPATTLAAGDFLANFLKGDYSSGMGNLQLNPPALGGNPEEFLNNLIKNADWIPKGYPGFDASSSSSGFDFGA